MRQTFVRHIVGTRRETFNYLSMQETAGKRMREKFCYMDKSRKCDETCACLQLFDGAWSCSAIRARVTPSPIEEVHDGSS